jgi:hypothetical protein
LYSINIKIDQDEKAGEKNTTRGGEEKRTQRDEGRGKNTSGYHMPLDMPNLMAKYGNVSKSLGTATRFL